MISIGTRLYTLFFGEYVGTDENGNKYYRGKLNDGNHVGRADKERRWCIYKGPIEPSRIPPHWHEWLHYIADNVPTDKLAAKDYEWQKKHKPNFTGTKHAYFPKGDPRGGGKRAKATGDYEAWNPNQ